MLMPIGLGNLSPEPTSYLTVDRPLTDQLIVPSVWRELGVGIFGQVVPGLRYEGAVVSGLDGTGLSAEAPLWGTRGNGSSIAAARRGADRAGGALRSTTGLIVGGGGYTGGASHGVDALSGLRVAIAEADLRYHNHGLDLRAEYARLWIVNSYLANDYFGLLGQSAIPSRGRGFYVEAGYDLLRLAVPESAQELVLFGGYENVDPRSQMSPYNYNPPTITGPGQLPPQAPSPSKAFVRGGHQLSASSICRAQARSAGRARRRGADANGTPDVGERAGDAPSDRQRRGGGGARRDACRSRTGIQLLIGAIRRAAYAASVSNCDFQHFRACRRPAWPRPGVQSSANGTARRPAAERRGLGHRAAAG